MPILDARGRSPHVRSSSPSIVVAPPGSSSAGEVPSITPITRSGLNPGRFIFRRVATAQQADLDVPGRLRFVDESKV
jgi:hypothetical protein